MQGSTSPSTEDAVKAGDHFDLSSVCFDEALDRRSLVHQHDPVKPPRLRRGLYGGSRHEMCFLLGSILMPCSRTRAWSQSRLAKGFRSLLGFRPMQGMASPSWRIVSNPWMIGTSPPSTMMVRASVAARRQSDGITWTWTWRWG